MGSDELQLPLQEVVDRIAGQDWIRRWRAGEQVVKIVLHRIIEERSQVEPRGAVDNFEGYVFALALGEKPVSGPLSPPVAARNRVFDGDQTRRPDLAQGTHPNHHDSVVLRAVTLHARNFDVGRVGLLFDSISCAAASAELANRWVAE